MEKTREGRSELLRRVWVGFYSTGRRDGGAPLLRRVAADWTRRPPLNGAAVHVIYSGSLLTSAGAEEDDAACSPLFPRHFAQVADSAGPPRFPAISAPQAEPSGLGLAWVRRRYFRPKRHYLGS